MRTRFASLLVAAVAGALLVTPGAASASTTEAIADTGGMTLTLGVPGSPLDVAVTLDEIGHITEVAVSDGFTEDKATDHRVRFTNDDGTTRIDVKARKDRLTASVKTDSLAGILGTHSWAGKLFGSDTDSVVTFDVLDSGGSPELANVNVASLFPADATYEIGEVKNENEGDEAESTVKVTFMWNGYTMTLKIQAELEHEDDDDSGYEAKLKITLKGRDIQKLSDQNLADLAGSYNWDGRFCDATPIAVAYTITETGDVVVDGVTVDGVASDSYELKDMPHGFIVKFDDSRAKLTVELKEKEPGLWDLKVRSSTTDKCNHDDDDDDRDKKDRGDDDDDDHDKKDHEKKDRDDDDDDDDHGDNHHDDDDDDNQGSDGANI